MNDRATHSLHSGRFFRITRMIKHLNPTERVRAVQGYYDLSDAAFNLVWEAFTTAARPPKEDQE